MNTNGILLIIGIIYYLGYVPTWMVLYDNGFTVFESTITSFFWPLLLVVRFVMEIVNWIFHK